MPLHMSGWFSGSKRRLNSSTLSCIVSASACLPSFKYVTARVSMALPARHKNKCSLTINKSHASHHSTQSSYLCRDGSQAARHACAPARFHPTQPHPYTFQVHGTSQQDCLWRWLHVTSYAKTHSITTHRAHAAHQFTQALHLCQDGSSAARENKTSPPFPTPQAHPYAFQIYRTS